jgi:hypothetical protein
MIYFETKRNAFALPLYFSERSNCSRVRLEGVILVRVLLFLGNWSNNMFVRALHTLLFLSLLGVLVQVQPPILRINIVQVQYKY